MRGWWWKKWLRLRLDLGLRWHQFQKWRSVRTSEQRFEDWNHLPGQVTGPVLHLSAAPLPCPPHSPFPVISLSSFAVTLHIRAELPINISAGIHHSTSITGLVTPHDRRAGEVTSTVTDRGWCQSTLLYRWTRRVRWSVGRPKPSDEVRAGRKSWSWSLKYRTSYQTNFSILPYLLLSKISPTSSLQTHLITVPDFPHWILRLPHTILQLIPAISVGCLWLLPSGHAAYVTIYYTYCTYQKQVLYLPKEQDGVVPMTSPRSWWVSCRSFKHAPGGWIPKSLKTHFVYDGKPTLALDFHVHVDVTDGMHVKLRPKKETWSHIFKQNRSARKSFHALNLKNLIYMSKLMFWGLM